MATYCICKKPDAEGVLWISCDKCKGWYHPSCVGLDEEEIDPDGDWFCPLCIRAGLVPAPIPTVVPLREARRCGRTKCGKLVEGNDLLCIDCKLIVIERNSNKLKRMRMEEDKSSRESNTSEEDSEPSPKRSSTLNKPRQSKDNNVSTSNNRMERSASKFKVQALMPNKKLKTKSITRKQPQTLVHNPTPPKAPVSPRVLPTSIDIDTLLSVPTTHTPNSPRKISTEVHKTPKEEANTSTNTISPSTNSSPVLSPPVSPTFMPLKKRSFDISRSESASSSMSNCVPLKKRIRSFDITTEPPKHQESVSSTSYSFTSPAPSSPESVLSHLERIEAISASMKSNNNNENVGQIKSGRHSPVAMVNNLSLRRDHTTDIDVPLNCSSSNFTLSSSNPGSTNSLGMLVSAMETTN